MENAVKGGLGINEICNLLPVFTLDDCQIKRRMRKIVIDM